MAVSHCLAWILRVAVIVFMVAVSSVHSEELENSLETWFIKRGLQKHPSGFIQAEVFARSLDGNANHVAVVWRKVEVDDERSLLEVFELTGDPGSEFKSELIGQASGSGLRFVGSWNGKDINGDGLEELVLESSIGGNCWGCVRLRFFQIDRRHLKELVIQQGGSVVPKSLRDLNGDGILEVIALDTAWEFYKDLCHACSPAVWVIYSWQDGRYVENSMQFPSFYEAEIVELEQHLIQAEDDLYIRPVRQRDGMKRKVGRIR